MNEHIVMTAEGYDRVDGRNAYRSDVKRLTLGEPMLEENKALGPAVQIWREDAAQKQYLAAELPIHRVLDLMLFLSRTLLYFKDAYRMPLLYDPERPMVERLGVQGDALSVAVCTENPQLDADIQKFAQALGELGELTGERLRVLSGILEALK